MALVPAGPSIETRRADRRDALAPGKDLMGSQRHVVVVGGGISGLASAYFLRRAEPAERLAVTVVEATGRLGGKVRTAQIAGHAVDTGPESLLVHSAPLRDFVDQLGLATAVVEPAVNGAYVWSRGRLRRLPAGTIAGVAARPVALLRSGLLSPVGLARAGADLVLPRERDGQDVSVRALVGRRFGQQVLHRLADPLLGGVYAGSVDRLSARSVVPELAAAARDSRSAAWGLRRDTRVRASGPSMVTLRGGLTRLVEALVAGLGDTQVLTGAPVAALEPAAAGHLLRLADGTELDADAVVLAVPAFAAADLLAGVSPQAAAALSGVPYSDVATVTLAYPREAIGRALDGTGFLVPSEEGLLLVGCTWLAAKWPHLAEGSQVLVRAMVGRHGDRRFADLDDATLVARVHAELVSIMALRAPPGETVVQRWPQALPQYTVGHEARLAQLDAALERLPGLHVTGAAYRGVGLAGCVSQAEQVVKVILADLARAADAEGSRP